MESAIMTDINSGISIQEVIIMAFMCYLCR